MAASDYYELLGVPKTASEDDLKKAYKKAAMKWHPDRFAAKGQAAQTKAEAKFKEMAQAYEVLSDGNKRAMYDRHGEAGLKGVPPPPRTGGPRWQPGAGDMPPPDFFNFTHGEGGRGGMPGGMPGHVHFGSSPGGAAGADNMSAERAAEIFAQLFAAQMGAGLAGRKRGGNAGGMPPGMGGLHGLSGMGGFDFSSLGTRAGGPAAAFSKRRHAAAAGVLPRGTMVKLSGLSDASRQGAVAKVDSYDAASDRYTVVLASRGERLAVKRSNLLVLIEGATVFNTSQPLLNGRRATYTVYDRLTGRYHCDGLSKSGTPVAIKRENLILPKGARVTIEGVQSRPSLNGMPASIVDVDRQAQRYLVRLENDELIRLKLGAVAAAAA